MPEPANDVGDDLGGQQFFLAPDHDVLEGVVDVVVAEQALVNGLDVIEEREVEVGVEGLDLVEIERCKQTVPPPECRVRIDQDVLVPLGERE